MPPAPEGTSVSWRIYDEEHKLSNLLTEAARACVSARATDSSEFLLGYFTEVTKGDMVNDLACVPVLRAGNGPHEGVIDSAAPATTTAAAAAVESSQGLRVRVGLFTHAEGSVDVARLRFDSAADAPVEGEGEGAGTGKLGICADGATAALFSHLNERVLGQLRAIGVRSQREWDSVVAAQRLTVPLVSPRSGATARSSIASSAPRSRASSMLAGTMERRTSGGMGGSTVGPASTTREVGMPAAAQLALSLAACVTAARSLHRPLYRHTHSVLAAAGASDAEPLLLPSVLIPFLGAPFGSDGAQPPAGCVRLHTLYIALSGDGSGSDGDEPQAMSPVTASLLGRLVRAAQALREANPAAPIRSDGAVVLENFENISDALAVATEALQAASLTPGGSLRFGLRLCPPVVTVGAAALPTSTPPPPSAADGGAAAAAPSGKKGAGTAGGGGKRGGGGGKSAAAAANPRDFTYAMFGGDADVTGQQITEYLKQQLAEANGAVAFLRDTHHTDDGVGLARLRRALPYLGCALCMPPPRTAPVPAPPAAFPSVEYGPVDFMGAGTLTRLAAVCAEQRRVASDGIALMIHPQDLTPLDTAVDVAVALGAEWLCTGGLTLPATCAALTRVLEVQEELVATRCLRLSKFPTPVERDPAVEEEEEEEPVPELKRKGDRKAQEGR